MKKFIEFLEKNKAWEKFERNFNRQKKDVDTYKKDCKEWKNYHLVGAFTWLDTPEGQDYWQKLHVQWMKENKTLKERLLSDD